MIYDFKCNQCGRELRFREREHVGELCNIFTDEPDYETEACHGTLVRVWTTSIHTQNLRSEH
jgi:hypothetical protein